MLRTIAVRTSGFSSSTLDGDGRPEVTAPNKGDQLAAGGVKKKEFPPKEISWFELPENPLDGKAWKEHVLTRVPIPINSEPVDMDGDGDWGPARRQSRRGAHILVREPWREACNVP